MSETWLSDEKEVEVGLEGNETLGRTEPTKLEGGVDLFVVSALKCKLIGDMTTV